MISTLRRIYSLLKNIFTRFLADKAFKHGAAISYYTVFSLPAILIIIVDLTGAFLGREEVKSEITLQIERLMGSETAQEVAGMITSLNQDQNSLWATLLGVGTLIFGATGVFYTLQDSINTIWRIPNKMEESGGILKLITDRILSLAMVLTMGFILMVSMILETAIVALKSLIENLEQRFEETLDNIFPGAAEVIQQIDLIFAIAYTIDLVVGLGIITLIFALLFRFLPSARIPWKDAWLGALVTSILFSVGKALIGWYIGSSDLASTYGAAGSVVLILVWVFYSSQILLFGAEFIYVYSSSRGREIEPARFVERLVDRPWLRLRLWIRRMQRRRRKAQKDQERREDLEKKEPVPVSEEFHDT